MRSWLVWCLRDKLADADVIDDVITRRQQSSSVRSSRRAGSTRARAAGSGTRQLVRQLAVHERSPRIGVVDCSSAHTTPAGSLPAGRVVLRRYGSSLDDSAGPGSAVSRVVLRCHSAETDGCEQLQRYHGDSSLDDDSASVTERLKVGASCSGQSSSFESYGSTG